MYEDFTAQARTVIQLARREAGRLGHDFLGTHHLLLGLLREETGVARLLRGTGVDPDDLYWQAEEAGPPEAEDLVCGQLPLTPSARRALEKAREQADFLNHPQVAPEHILLGLLGESGSDVAQLFDDAGLRLDELRARLRALPPPEDRDAMIQSHPGSRSFPAPDPSPGDVAALASVDVLAARKSRADLPGGGDVGVATRSLLYTQFRCLKAVLGGSAYGLAGALLFGTRGAVVGAVLGLCLSLLKSTWVTLTVSLTIGLLAGALPAAPGEGGLRGFLGLVLGVLVGGCMGEWSRVERAPGGNTAPKQ